MLGACGRRGPKRRAPAPMTFLSQAKLRDWLDERVEKGFEVGSEELAHQHL